MVGFCVIVDDAPDGRPAPPHHVRGAPPTTLRAPTLTTSPPRSRDEVGIGCLVADLTYSNVLDAVGGDAGSLAPRSVDAP